MALFTLLSAALICSNLFGLRMYRVTQAKLTAGGDARMAVGRMSDEIRASKLTLLGTGTASSFQAVTNGSPQVGNAIKVHSTTNLNHFIVYYLDAGSQTLIRRTSASSALSRIAGSITNNPVFSARDYQGNVLTNNQNNRIINLKLEFYHPQNPGTAGASGNLFDYYKLETAVTRRALE